jgi:hypothetical protein
MNKIFLSLKKALLAVTAAAIVLAVFPTLGVSAAELQDSSTPPETTRPGALRLEWAWQHLQKVYGRQGRLLDKSDEFIDRVQGLIDRANEKDWDTSLVQAALDAFASVIPQVRAAHNPGKGIIASHQGFDDNGKVVDRAKAIETVQSLKHVITETRQAIDGTFHVLMEAIREFRQTHQPEAVPAQ